MKTFPSFVLRAFVLMSASAVLSAPTSAPTPLTREQVRGFIEPYVAENYVPALVVGIADDSGARVEAAGADDHAKPATAQTIFEIGSVTKTFTGLLLADAVTRGEVQFSDAVQSLLPGTVKLAQVGPRPIELIDLATQRSGLPRMPSNLKPADATKPYDDYTVAQLYDFLNGCKPSDPPGAHSLYSNLGAGLLGHVLALRAGKTYPQLVRERIFQPMGIDAEPLSGEVIAGHLASGLPTSNWLLPEPIAGAGCLRMSGEQLLTYVAAQMKPPTGLAQAIAQSQTARATFEGTNNSIGLFWMIRPDGVYWHNGETGGFSSYVGFDPAAHVGVVVLTNTAASHAVEIGVTLLHRETHRPDPPITKVRHAVELPIDQLEKFVGNYRVGLLSMISIRRHQTHLVAQITGQQPAEIFPESPTSCFWKLVDAQADFQFAPEGSKQITIHQAGHDTHGTATTMPTTRS